MDFHAHLNMNEVIGLLAGECDEDQRLIRYVGCAVAICPQSHECHKAKAPLSNTAAITHQVKPFEFP